MARQIKHVRVSKNGKPFRAGSRKKVPDNNIVPKPVRSEVFVVADVIPFKKVVGLVKELVVEGTFFIRPEGLGLRSTDPANVAMINVLFKDSLFSEYPFPNKGLTFWEHPVFAVNIDNLAVFLKGMKKNDIFQMKILPNNIILTNKTRNAEVTLPQIDIEELKKSISEGKTEPIKLPELKPTYHITVKPEDFIYMIKQADIVGESVSFISGNNKLDYVSEGDFNKSVGSVPGNSVGDVGVKAKYSIEYLEKLLVVSTLFDNMKLSFAKNYPLVISFDDKRFAITFILAPRIDNDEYTATPAKEDVKPAKPFIYSSSPTVRDVKAPSEESAKEFMKGEEDFIFSKKEEGDNANDWSHYIFTRSIKRGGMSHE